MNGRRRRGEDRPAGDAPDEAELFRRTLGDVVPLKRKRQRAPAVAPAAPPRPLPDPAKKRRPAKPAGPATAPTPSPAPPPPAPPPLDAGGFAGVDRRTAERLRRGKLAIDARLDLHGMFQDAAHEALNDFVADSAAAGRRVVLVITGRGSREGSGVLRERLPQWLNMPACRRHVLAFVRAQPGHGGAGAFYVLLRRRRGEDGRGDERGAR